MPHRIIVVKTHKISSFYGTQKPWYNTWAFSVPFKLSDYTYNRFVTELVRLEAQFHHSHVRFPSVTGIYADSIGQNQEDEARSNAPFNGNITGFWGNPPVIAPFHWVKRIRFYADAGYGAQKWFRGGLATVDVEPVPGGKQRMVYQDFWQSTVNNWATYMVHNFDAHMRIGQGINRYGMVVRWAPVVAYRVAGVTFSNDLKKAALLHPQQGKNLYEQLNSSVEIFEEYRNFLYDQLEFNGDFGTGFKIIEDFKTLAGDVKAVSGKMESWAKGEDEQGNEGTAPDVRFGPTPEQILTLASSIKDKVQKDIEDVEKIPLYPNPGSQQYMKHTDIQEVFDKCDKYSAALSQYIACDLRKITSNA